MRSDTEQGILKAAARLCRDNAELSEFLDGLANINRVQVLETTPLEPVRYENRHELPYPNWRLVRV